MPQDSALLHLSLIAERQRVFSAVAGSRIRFSPTEVVLELYLVPVRVEAEHRPAMFPEIHGPAREQVPCLQVFSNRVDVFGVHAESEVTRARSPVPRRPVETELDAAAATLRHEI